MGRIILKILTVCLSWTLIPVAAQEIRSENFSTPEKGIWGTETGNIQSDFSGITSWNLEYSSIDLSDPGDYAKTVATSGGRFEACDIDGEVVWRSEWIDISGFEKVSIELIASETGSGANTETKYLKAFYRIDGGEELIFHENGENAGNWGSATAKCEDITGETLQIVCYISTHYSSDKVILDEIKVWNDRGPLPPVNPFDVVINEILFNPFPDGEDYVEIYNLSEKLVDLNRLFLANRDKDGNLNQVYPLAAGKNIFYPESYLTLTKDTQAVFPWFYIQCPACFLQMEKVPSFPNAEGYVVLLNEEMEIIDEFYYSEKMHTPFLADVEGVSLERISFSTQTNASGNWHSASTESGYGTPGYKNSQAGNELSGKPQIIFEPGAFSPNHDGYNDEYIIHYKSGKAGYVGNIKIFDAAGRFVQHLAKNEILGTTGTFTWNGEDETGQRQPLGVYIVMVEIFNREGEIHRFKNGVVLTDIF